MRGAAAALAGAVCLLTAPVHADVKLNTRLSSRKVEVGDRFVLRLSATSDDGRMPQSPQLALPNGVEASSPQIAAGTRMDLMTGKGSVELTATWVLVASKTGKLKLGPASVMTDAGRKSDAAVTVEVVPKGTLAQRPPPLAGQPLDPLDILRGMGRQGMPGFPSLPGFLGEPEEEPPTPELPEEYRVERALDPLAFVRSRAQPRKVVVGEQVTLSVYAYGGRGGFELGSSSEPSRDDFLAFNLMEPGQQVTGYRFPLNGEQWQVVKIQEWALFPLKAGKLKAGAMSFDFRGRNYSRDPRGIAREAQAAEINVVEPPLSGRPPGYRLGDVGHYRLSARVEPREIPAGGSISVVAKLEGTGNLPFTLLLPEQRGVRWLEPQLVDQVGPRERLVQGFRTFTYVVELSQPGAQDLGEITLPYFDVKSRAYGVARASLGTINVTGTAKPDAQTPDASKPSAARLRSLVAPPAKLGAWQGSKPTYLTDRAGFWACLFGLPAIALLGFALSDAGKSLGLRRKERRGSLATALDDALGQLSAAAARADVGAAASAAERALVIAIEKSTGVKARGILKSQLPSTLQDAGLSPELATSVSALLGRCDELRFAGEATELSTFVADTRASCKKLGALKAKAEPAGA